MDDQQGTPSGDRPTAELVRDLSQQATTLVRQELELAKLELAEKGKKVGVGAGLVGAGGLLALFGGGALVAAAILGLATALEGWLAALVVAVVLLALAGVLALVGKKRAQSALPASPRKAVAEGQETVAAVKAAAQDRDGRIAREHEAAAR
jgi:MFS family permease